MTVKCKEVSNLHIAEELIEALHPKALALFAKAL